MEVDIPPSTLPLQLEQTFVGCPLSFVREFLVSLGRRLTQQKSLGTQGPGDSSGVSTNLNELHEFRSDL